MSEFFIGWDKPGPQTRRNFLGLAAFGAAAAGAAALTLGMRSVPGGDGTWDQSDVRIFEGMATARPYPLLRMATPGGGMRTYLIGSQGKCGVAARLREVEGRMVRLRGSLIRRGSRGLIALADSDWMQPLPGHTPEILRKPPVHVVGPVEQGGEILDAKCWLGAMRPGHGKPHKSCARLCIRGGLPPIFFPYSGKIGSAMPPLLLVSPDLDTAQDMVLDHIGDPVKVRGELVSMGGLDMLRLSRLGALSRL